MQNNKKTPIVECDKVLIGLLFRMAWPVWKMHNGKVPEDALEQLEHDGDWPHGLATAIMRRLSRDAALRKQLEEYLANRPLK
jgi:hypothetical protein